MQRWLWRQISDIGPKPRQGHDMVYDPDRDRVILFGGFVKGMPAGKERATDTWEWDGENWIQMEDIGPPGRTQFGMAYDSSRKRVVVYGGIGNANQYLTDTWEWDGTLWTQVANSGPSNLGGHAMTYDKRNGYCLLYGGPTWTWDGNDWTQRNEIGFAHVQAVLAYDDVRDYPILVSALFNNEPAGTTWRWDSANWRQMSDMGPAYNPAQARLASDGKRLVLYKSSTLETWQWDGTHWIQRQDIGPSPRMGTAMVGDTTRQRSILFGGLETGASEVGDTWVLSVTEA